jgi:hypothetical protein
MKKENSVAPDYTERLFTVSDAGNEIDLGVEADIGDVISDAYEILRENDVPQADSVGFLFGKLLRSRPRLFYGKMTMNNKGRYGVSFKGMNLIPGLYYPNVQAPLLLSFCGDGDDFGYRMFETVTRVYRSNGENKTVVLFTALWDQAAYRRVAADIEMQGRLFGTRYVFVLVSDKGASEIKA